MPVKHDFVVLHIQGVKWHGYEPLRYGRLKNSKYEDADGEHLLRMSEKEVLQIPVYHSLLRNDR